MKSIFTIVKKVIFLVSLLFATNLCLASHHGTKIAQTFEFARTFVAD